jgi:hypothetical protein
MPDIDDTDDLSSEDDEDQEEDEEEDDNQDQETSTATDRKDSDPSPQQRPPVRYFQQALSVVWERLPRSIRREYERKALEWRIDGPSKEMQRKYV